MKAKVKPRANEMKSLKGVKLLIYYRGLTTDPLLSRGINLDNENTREEKYNMGLTIAWFGYAFVLVCCFG